MPDQPIKQLVLTSYSAPEGAEICFKEGEDDLYVDGISASFEDILELVMERAEFWIEARGTSVYHAKPIITEDDDEYKDSYEAGEEPETEDIDEVADVYYWVADLVQVIVFR